jgi:hypothetical protein
MPQRYEWAVMVAITEETATVGLDIYKWVGRERKKKKKMI